MTGLRQVDEADLLNEMRDARRAPLRLAARAKRFRVAPGGQTWTPFERLASGR